MNEIALSSVNREILQAERKLRQLKQERERIILSRDANVQLGNWIAGRQNNAVIRFERTFEASGRTYSFAAIKHGVFWYVTQQAGTNIRRMNTPEFSDWLIEGKVHTIHEATFPGFYCVD